MSLADISELRSRCIAEVSEARALVLYVREGETLKGALVEVGDVQQSWINHPLVIVYGSVKQAMDAAKSLL